MLVDWEVGFVGCFGHTLDEDIENSHVVYKGPGYSPQWGEG